MDRQFGNPNYWLVLLPVIFTFLAWRLGLIYRKVYSEFSGRDKQNSRYITSKLRQEILLSAFFWFLFALAALRPQWGYTWEESSRSGVDIAVVVDVSDSMLCSDLSPSRLKRAERAIVDLLEILQGDRISLVAFSGVAFIEAPLTQDYTTFRLFLNSLNPSLIPIKGTNIEIALLKAVESLKETSENGEPALQKRSKAILLITDGESFQGDYSKVVDDIKRQNIDLSIIGVGTSEGGPIRTESGIKRDRSGKVVITKLNENALMKLSSDVGGHYYSMNDSTFDLSQIYTSGVRNRLRASELKGGGKIQVWNEVYQLPLVLGLLLLLAHRASELRLISRSRGTEDPHQQGKPTHDKPIFTSLLLVAAACLCSLLHPSVCSAQETNGSSGTSPSIASSGSNNPDVLNETRNQTPSVPDDTQFKLTFDKGVTAYRKGNFQVSAYLFSKSLQHASSDSERAEALFNIGNSLTQLGYYEKALESFKKAQSLSPSDKEISDNIGYVQKLIQATEQKNSEDEDSSKNQESKENKDSDQPEKSQDKDSANGEQEKEDKNKTDPSGQGDSQTPGDSEKRDSEQKDVEAPQQAGTSKDKQKEKGITSSDQHSMDNTSEKDDEHVDENSDGEPSQEDNRGDERKEQEKKNTDQQPPHDEKTNETNAGDQPKQGSAMGADEQLQDQLESLLGGVQEQTANYEDFREQEALRIYKKYFDSLPRKDW